MKKVIVRRPGEPITISERDLAYVRKQEAPAKVQQVVKPIKPGKKR